MATPTIIAEAYEKAQADYREAIQTEEREIRELADAYLEKRPKAKKRWEENVAAQQEANSLDRKLGLAMDFGLVKPAELIDQPVGSPAA